MALKREEIELKRAEVALKAREYCMRLQALRRDESEPEVEAEAEEVVAEHQETMVSGVRRR